MAKKPTSADRKRFVRVGRMNCLVCQKWPVEVHHVIGYADKMGRASKRHDRVVPLCPFCHRHSLRAVHTIGHQRFFADNGIDLMAEAERLSNG